MEAHTCNSCLLESEARGWWAESHPGLLSDSLLMKKKGNNKDIRAVLAGVTGGGTRGFSVLTQEPHFTDSVKAAVF